MSVLEKVAALVAGPLADRAPDYDERGVFPTEDFDDLFANGVLGATVPREHGGLGFGPVRRDTLSLWSITSLLAKADLSLARCWEGHTNSLVLIDALGSSAQQRRWFAGVVERGERWVAWSGEPQTPGAGRRFGTTVTVREDGWVIDGTKAFATSATGAQWAILLVDVEGPGGARHSGGSGDGLLMLACSLADPSITLDSSWWNPIGMRATVSHVVKFDQTFIPRDQLIGEPGSYLRGGWQTAFVPHYAASFLGAAQAAYDYAVDYLRRQGKGTDPYVQQRVGAMDVNIQGGRLWLEHVARLWDEGKLTEARHAGSQARHVIEHLAEEVVHHTIRSCGARSLVKPAPIERILRDLTFYLRHDNDDHILATLGRYVLGEAHDLSFYKP